MYGHQSTGVPLLGDVGHGGGVCCGRHRGICVPTS